MISSGASRTEGRLRRVPLLALLGPLLVVLASVVAPPTSAAALPDLTIVADTRYVVQPAHHRIHVIANLTVTNNRADTTTTRYYFDSAFLAVLPGSQHFSLTSSGVKPSVKVRTASSRYTLLQLNLGRRLGSGGHMTLSLAFDLPDAGGEPSRDVRVGTSLVSFPAWAFATSATPGGTVTVILPKGFTGQLSGTRMRAPVSASNGSTIYRSGPLTKPLSFFVYVVADKPGAYRETRQTLSLDDVPVSLAIRAWADDSAWAKRIGGLVRRALPAISAAIGLPYQGDGLIVQESVSRAMGGYAGRFDPASQTIEVAYFASSFVALHETAHAWLNGGLVADRWIGEGFASYYAAQAARVLKLKVTPPALTKALQKARIPLNAWPATGRSNPAVEDYAYAAGYRLASLIASRAGTDGLQEVWTAARNREPAYLPVQGGADAEGPPAGPPDWRGLLDLLEERTGEEFADLWLTWVARPADEKVLDGRRVARAQYRAVVAAAGDWELPAAIRAAMGAWRFDQAGELLGSAGKALEKREDVTARATAAGLELPVAMRDAFQGPAGPAAAISEGDREIDAIEAFSAADRAGSLATGFVEQVGLFGSDPAAELERARKEFAAGELDAVRERAALALEAWTQAGERGRQRLLLVLGLIVVAVAVAVGTALVRRRRAVRYD